MADKEDSMTNSAPLEKEIADLRETAPIEMAQQIVTLMTCPYILQTGDKHCVSGCHEEPECYTGPPGPEEIVEVAQWVADNADALLAIEEAAKNLLAGMGIESSDPRLAYDSVQVDKDDVARLRSALAVYNKDGSEQHDS